MRVLVIGSGARENAIADALLHGGTELYAYMNTKNPGIHKYCRGYTTGNLEDAKGIGDFATANKVELAVVGPEAPLAAGVADELIRIGVKCFGPTKELAKLETSKAFLRSLLEKYRINASPKFRVFRNYDEKGMLDLLEELGEYVIKPDGLTGGKGVKLSGEHLAGKEDALAYCEEVLQGHGCVIIEEKLDGEEFSLQTIADGMTAIDCPAVQDHKRAHENDEGGNTGGMGSYSDSNHSLPFLDKADLEEAHEITVRVMRALKKETGSFIGIMYGGFMATKKGVKLLEYNARFGDPEAMNVLPLLKAKLADVCAAAANEELGSAKVEFEKKATVCKYVVPEGYPDRPATSKIEIEKSTSALTYHAAVEEREDGLYTTKSRAVAFVGVADTIEEAEKIAEEAAKGVKGSVYHRKDIGTEKLVQKRVEHMRRLRG